MPPADEPVASDAELVERANRGDAAAFEELYRRHRDWVVALAYRLTRDRDDALDVLQDAFAHLFARFPGFELTASLRSYLFPVVQHIALDRQRRRRRTDDLEAAGDVAAPENAEAGAALGLERAVDELSEGHREVVRMRFVEDRSLEQIADATGLPLGTVKSRLHHALANLRRRLRGG